MDDFGLQPMHALDTADIYELIVELHLASSTVSNREPVEWLGQLSDALRGLVRHGRLKSAAHELVLEEESHCSHENPTRAPSAHYYLGGLADDGGNDLDHDSRDHQSANTGYLAEGWTYQAGGRQCRPLANGGVRAIEGSSCAPPRPTGRVNGEP